MLCRDSSAMTLAEETLQLSAQLARQAASRLCRKDPISGQDCSWYHGLWQDLRLMGLAATPEYQADFFSRAFALFKLRCDRPRLLISGAADYAILAQVLSACEAHQLHADITVLDACDTPLLLNNWYAKRSGHSITTVRANIFDYRAPTSFDVVCAHSFLGQFPSQRRTELIGKWRQMLRTGGSILNVNRIRADSTPHKIHFSQDQADAFRASVMQKAAEMPAELQPNLPELTGRVETYIERLYIYALSADDIVTAFKEHHFYIDDFFIASPGSISDHNLSGLAIPKNAEHACIIATRTAAA